jgi:hypothetical protein
LPVCGSKCGDIQEYRRGNLAISAFVLQGAWGQLLCFLSTEEYTSLNGVHSNVLLHHTNLLIIYTSEDSLQLNRHENSTNEEIKVLKEHSIDEEFFLLGYNSVWSVESQL